MSQREGKTTLVLMGNESGGTRAIMRVLLQHTPPAYRPEIVMLGDGGMARELLRAGLPLTRLGISQPMIIREASDSKRSRVVMAYVRNVAWLLERVLKLAGHLKSTRSPVVHCNLGYGALVVMAAKMFCTFKFVCHWHGVGLCTMHAFVRPLTHCVDRFIAISEAVKLALPAAWHARTQIIYNAVDVDGLSENARKEPGRLRTLIHAGDSTPLVVCLGTYAKHKGQHLLIRAMERVAQERRDVLCVFVGHTTATESRRYFTRLQEQAQALGIASRCRFLLDIPEAATLFDGASVAAMTTFGLGEGFGLVAVEAMACAVPVVAFDAGAAREVIEDQKTGLLVRDEDYNALAHAILVLVNHPKRARAMGQAGLARARQRFDAPRLAKEMCQMYKHVASDQCELNKGPSL